MSSNQPLLEFLQEVSFSDPDWSCLPAGSRERYGPAYTTWETPGGWIFLHKHSCDFYAIARGLRKGTWTGYPPCSSKEELRFFALTQYVNIPNSLNAQFAVRYIDVQEEHVILELRATGVKWSLPCLWRTAAVSMAFQVVSWRMPLGIYLDWLQDWLADTLPEEAEKLRLVLNQSGQTVG
jgi:hypothetical protein